METDVELGHRLRMARIARGILQKDLALEAGLSKKHLNQLELGKVPFLKLRCGVVVRLAQVLAVSTDYLLGLSSESTIRFWQPTAVA